MELRSYNVERVYAECVKCRIGDEVGVNADKLNERSQDIKDMLNQISRENDQAPLALCHLRTDGEVWTPYLQIVEMLILLGARIGAVEFTGPLKSSTIINFKVCQK